MARRIFDFDPPDRFLAGTVGIPGQRTFYLQARRGDELVSVALEKIQVALLAERLDALIEELRGRGLAIPDEIAAEDETFEMPVEEAFRVATLSIAWDTRTEEVILEARAQSEADPDAEIEVDDDDPTGPDLIRVRLTPTAALIFSRRAESLVAAGRLPCPICGEPLDPTGHFCTRQNGHKLN